MRKILADGVIRARDQNRVFVEKANARRLSPADAMRKYGLLKGKANAYVEFDVEEGELELRPNAATKNTEYVIHGDVDLSNRDAVPFFNF
jgi:hypothetical protein